MRKLNRPLNAPTCLSNYDHNTHSWTKSSPNSAFRTAIWQKLEVMQSGFCVYCESVAVKGNGHIEHFFHKGKKPDGTLPYKHLTFDWNNLFGCCGLFSGSTCGHYKDRQGNKGPSPYDPNDLVKSDIDDPKEFFSFLDTGVIEPKSGLTGQKLKKATETIRVLNLVSLNGARKKQIDIFKKELKELEEISRELDDQTLLQAMENIREKVKREEFQTAVLEALF